MFDVWCQILLTLYIRIADEIRMGADVVVYTSAPRY